MTARKTKVSRLRKAALETAKGMHAAGIMSDIAFHKITLRDVAGQSSLNAEPVLPGEIRALREAAQMSQAVFAQRLNLTAGHLSKLERGTLAPTGPALALFNIIKNKGVDILLP